MYLRRVYSVGACHIWEQPSPRPLVRAWTRETSNFDTALLLYIHPPPTPPLPADLESDLAISHLHSPRPLCSPPHIHLDTFHGYRCHLLSLDLRLHCRLDALTVTSSSLCASKKVEGLGGSGGESCRANAVHGGCIYENTSPCNNLFSLALLPYSNIGTKIASPMDQKSNSTRETKHMVLTGPRPPAPSPHEQCEATQ